MKSLVAPAETAVAEAAPPPKSLSMRMPRLKRAQVLAGVAFLALGFLPLAFGSFGLYIAAYVAVWAMLELSIVVVTGYAGMISLMPFTFVGIGACTTGVAVAVWGWPFWLAVPLAALATVPVSVMVGAASVRLKGLYLAIATLTFGNALGETLFKWDDFTGGQAGHVMERPKLGALSFSGDFAFYVLSIATALLMVWAVHGLKNSRAGRAMLAVRDNEREAQALGINATKAKLTALVVGGMIAGVGGAFYLALLETVARSGFQSPYVELTSLLLVVWAVIGGIDSAFGAFLGAIALITQTVVFQGAERVFAYVGVYAAFVLIIFLLLRPGGIVQVVKIQAERIRENPSRAIPASIIGFGIQVAIIVVILVYGAE
ncbi:MAG TPA: branched-chain amino acid ABC transporter permease [Actinomycetota bacterium]|nr:branched-chain amino acid ABC transporter permease [Actinomycetota bacterium]